MEGLTQERNVCELLFLQVRLLALFRVTGTAGGGERRILSEAKWQLLIAAGINYCECK